MTSNDTAPAPEEPKKMTFNPKLLLLLALIGFVIYVVIDSFTAGTIKTFLTNFLETVEELGFTGILLFTLVYMVATVLLIPGTILTLGAGFVFTQTNGGNQATGTLIATCVVFIGATVGATLAYIVAKFLLRETVSQWATKYRVFKAIDKAIQHNGVKIVFLLRLSPALPFNVLNYLLGITSVSLRDYVIACLGLLPGTVVFCFFGSTLGSLGEVSDGGKEESSDPAADRLKLIILIVGIIASIVAIVAVTVLAKRELNKFLVEEDEDDEQSEAMEEGESQPPTAEYIEA